MSQHVIQITVETWFNERTRELAKYVGYNKIFFISRFFPYILPLTGEEFHLLHWGLHFILLINQQRGHYNREISDQGLDGQYIYQGRGLRFPCNDRMDKVNKLFIIWPFQGNEYVVVNFLSQVIFVFLLFLGMIMYANEVETKEK